MATTDGSGYYEFSTVNYDVGYQLTVNKPGTWTGLTCACLDSNGADVSGGETSGICSATITVDSDNPNRRVDFSIVDVLPGWFQVIDGDIHANDDIYNPVP